MHYCSANWREMDKPHETTIMLENLLKKNLNASRPSEHLQVRGENVKTFRGGHRLQRQNLFMAFKRVPRW